MAQHLEQLSVLAQQSNGRWYPNMSEETINSIESFLLAHDPSILEEWLGYKEGGMSDELFAFQDRLTIGVDDTEDSGQTELVITLTDGSKLVFTEDASHTGLTQIAAVEDEKEVFDQEKDNAVREPGGPSHYYVENNYSGQFALVEAALLPKLEGRKDSLGTPLFIRPMHGEENWDKTINHEEQFDKIYCVLDESNIEDFLAD